MLLLTFLCVYLLFFFLKNPINIKWINSKKSNKTFFLIIKKTSIHSQIQIIPFIPGNHSINIAIQYTFGIKFPFMPYILRGSREIYQSVSVKSSLNKYSICFFDMHAKSQNFKPEIDKFPRKTRISVVHLHIYFRLNVLFRSTSV